MTRYLRQLVAFLRFQPSYIKSPPLNQDERRELEQVFNRKAGIKLKMMIDAYVSDCAYGAATTYGHEASHKNGFTLGAMGLRAYILSQFRSPSTNDGTLVEDESGIPDELT